MRLYHLAMSTVVSSETSPLAACMAVFRQKGLVAPTDAELAGAMGLAPETLAAQYGDRPTLVLQALLNDMERQKHEHTRLYDQYPTSVERLYALLDHSIQDLLVTDPRCVSDLAQFPAAGQALQDHLASYSTPQLHQLLNDGIRHGLFRSDINIRLVTIIIVQQVNIVLTPGIFPTGGFQLAEIFRSVFLYYIRGLCTEQGARLAAEHFARI